MPVPPPPHLRKSRPARSSKAGVATAAAQRDRDSGGVGRPRYACGARHRDQFESRKPIRWLRHGLWTTSANTRSGQGRYQRPDRRPTRPAQPIIVSTFRHVRIFASKFQGWMQSFAGAS